MEITNIKDCLKFRLLRKIKPDLEKAGKSLDIARKKISSSETALKFNIANFTILDAYLAMFHAARAVLYKDGIQEKSHFAIFIYLKEKYVNEIPLFVLNLLNVHRVERHEVMYGLEYEPKKEDALTALKDAKLFVKEIERILKV